MWKLFINFVGAGVVCIAGKAVRQMWRRGTMEDLCDAAAMAGGIVGILVLTVADALGYGTHEPVTQSLVEELETVCKAAACALAMFITPRFATRFLITRALRRRFGTLKVGDRLVMMGNEFIMVCSEDAHCTFIGSERGYKCVMVLDKDMFFRVMAHTVSSPRLPRCPRGELVGLVREKAAGMSEFPCIHERLVVVAWQLERPVRVIQRAVRRALSNPGFLMCRRRLQREWLQLRGCAP